MNIQGWFPLELIGLLSVQGTVKNLLQHHSLKASVLWYSAFFMVQLSHLYITIRKTIALTRWAFVGKVMSFLYNMLFRFVIAFLPKSKHLLISQLQSPSAVIWGSKKIKSVTVSIFPHLFAMKWWAWTGEHCFSVVQHIHLSCVFSPLWFYRTMVFSFKELYSLGELAHTYVKSFIISTQKGHNQGPRTK